MAERIRWQATKSPTKRKLWHIVRRGCQLTPCGKNCLLWQHTDRVIPRQDSATRRFCKTCWRKYERAGW